jgi:hypothetical protein
MHSIAFALLLLPAVPPRMAASSTWCRDVAPIVQRHCESCHRAGQVGPFELRTYHDALGWSAMIREVVTAGRMPPWGADPRFGRFSNDPSLTEAEKKTLLDWIHSGCPEGDTADLPPPVTYPDEWNIGKPDAVVTMASEFRVPAEGVIEYQSFVVDPGFQADRWVTAAEIRPGNRKVVHHCNVFLQPPGASGVWEQGSLGSYCLAALAQGTPPMSLPDGMAKRIPAGWKLVFVMHYTPIGIVQTDRTSIALHFTEPSAVRKEVATRLMLEPNLQIPPGEPNYRVEQTWRVNEEVSLFALFPHMHLRGKSFRYLAVYPDKSEEILLDVPRFDFGWQTRYALAEPKRLPAGSLLRCTAVYDNSTENPANPDPSRWVLTGTQSWEEMFNGYFDVAIADQDLTRPAPWYAGLTRAVWQISVAGWKTLALLIGGIYLVRRPLRTWLPSKRAADENHYGPLPQCETAAMPLKDEKESSRTAAGEAVPVTPQDGLGLGSGKPRIQPAAIVSATDSGSR